jgi:formate-dependent nitrite reductase membrane component NrfD
MFFAGIGAGAFAVSFVLFLFDEIKETAIISALLSLLFVILGLVFLMVEINSLTKVRRIFSGLSTSWMSRGALIQVLYIIFVLGYAILLLRPSTSGTIVSVVGAIALILAVIITVYHGLVLSKTKAIPFWSSSALPLVFFLDALCGGLGLTLLVRAAYYTKHYFEISGVFSILEVLSIVLTVGAIISLWSMTRFGLNTTYSESLKRVKVPLTIAATSLGLCFVLLSWGFWIGGKNLLMIIFIICGVLLLINSFATRYSIVEGGYYYPLQIRLSR